MVAQSVPAMHIASVLRASGPVLGVIAGLLVAASAVHAASPDASHRHGPTRGQVLDAVEAHRLSERDQILRDEAMVGRRLTPAERAQLREQLRHEWGQRQQLSSEAAVDPVDGSGWRWRSLLFWRQSE